MAEKSKFRKVAEGIGATIGVAGVFAGFDFLDGTINHPFGALAVGTGFAAGIETTKKQRDWTNIYVSLGALAASMFPQYVHLAEGDVKTFVGGALVKTLAYGAGLAMPVVIDVMGSTVHDSQFDLTATFRTNEEAQQVYSTLESMLKSGKNISSDRSSISEPESTDHGYRIEAKVLGKGVDLLRTVQPTISRYLASRKPEEYTVSTVILTD